MATIEDVRAFWSANPCNIRRSAYPTVPAIRYSEIMYNKRRVEPATAAFAQFAHWDGKFVLEVGCGLGIDAIDFAKAGASVVAVDVSRRSIVLAQEHAEAAGVGDRIAFLERDMEKIGEDRRLSEPDLIWSFGAIHHTPDPGRALQELRKLAGDETLLRVMLYHRDSWKWWTEMRGDASRSEAVGGCPVTHAYTRGEARDLLEDSGWRVRDLRVRHIFTYQIAAYNRGEYRVRGGWRFLPRGVFRGIEKVIGWHLLVEAEPK